MSRAITFIYYDTHRWIQIFYAFNNFLIFKMGPNVCYYFDPNKQAPEIRKHNDITPRRPIKNLIDFVTLTSI